MKQKIVKPVTTLIPLVLSVVSGFHQHHNRTIPVSKLPHGTLPQLKNLLTYSSSALPDHCPLFYEGNVHLLLFTRTNPIQPIVLNRTNPVQIHPTGKIVIIIHGWVSSPASWGFPALKDAYLRRYDCSVIMVDWSIAAWNLYTGAFCAIPDVARLVANFLCLLQQRQSVSLNSVHLVGHSFGAQMSSLISQNTLAMCRQQVGRITGMDPAKPLFEGRRRSVRLDKNDAIFVDVIHTNSGFLGFYGNCGDVDFHVNCGAVQPGCPYIHLDELLDHPIAAISCSHFRSVELMAESINSRRFKALSCRGCPMVCHPDLVNSTEITMGEDCTRHAPGAYVLHTASKAPFALGST